ncbi:hypothetical protein ACFL47_03375 [Candidatus Latescibacterota bacterium]
MKTLLKLFATFAAVIFTLIAVIKFVQGCTWKEAVGIAEEFFKELRENCPCCSMSSCDDEVAESD